MERPSSIVPLDVFQLPLWDNEEQASLSLQDWKNMLKQQDEIRLYSRNEKQEYLDMLDEHGMDRHSISILKHINESEGSIDTFFLGATDNLGLFHKLIIPSINDKIENIDSRNREDISNLTTSFKETLKISKELPHLLAVIENVEHVTSLIAPLQELLDTGRQYLIHVEQVEAVGAAMLAHLQTIVRNKQFEQQQLSQQIGDAQKDVDTLQWKIENTKYSKSYHDYEKLQQKFEDVSLQDTNVQQELVDTQQAKKQMQVNIHLRKKTDLESEARDIQERIDMLTHADEYVQAQHELEDIRSYFQREWNSLYSSWKKKITSHTHYIQALDRYIEQAENELETAKKRENSSEHLISNLKASIKNHEDAIPRMLKHFGEKIQFFPAEVLEDAQRDYIKKEHEIQTLANQNEQAQQTLEERNIQIGKSESNLFTKGKEIKELQQQIEAQKRLEMDIIANASTVLQEEVYESFDKAYFFRIQRLLEQKEHILTEELQRCIVQQWKAEEDVYLLEKGMDKDIFIPNHDLIRVKELLDEMKIENLYGTEFLKSLSPEERTYELSRNPSLLYSIVVVGSPFLNCDFSLLEEELLQCNVVIIDRTKVNESDALSVKYPFFLQQTPSTYVVQNRAYSLIQDEDEWDFWKHSVAQRMDEAALLLKQTQKQLRQVRHIQKQVDILLEKPISTEWNIQLQKLQNEYASLQHQHEELQAEIESCKQHILYTKESIRRANDELTAIEKKKEAIEAWKKETDVYLQNKKDLDSSIEKLAEQQQAVKQLKDEWDKLKTKHTNAKQHYNSWHQKLQTYFVKFADIVPGCIFPEPELARSVATLEHDSSLTYPKLGKHLNDEAYKRYIRLKNLEDIQNKNNVDLGECRSDLKKKRETILEQEELLYELIGEGWRDMGIPEEDLMLLSFRDKQLNDEIARLENDIHYLQLQGKELNGRLGVKREYLEEREAELKKTFPEFGAVYIQVDNYEVLEAEYKKDWGTVKERHKSLCAHGRSLEKQMAEWTTVLQTLESIALAFKQTYILTQEEQDKLLLHPTNSQATWLEQREQSKKQLEEQQERISSYIHQIRDEIQNNEMIPSRFRNGLLNFLSSLRDSSYPDAMLSIKNYLEWAEHNLQDEMEQKQKAEAAVGLWVERASRRVMEMIQGMQEMIRNMTVKNWEGKRFPLLRLERHYRFPEHIHDVTPSIREFCHHHIERFVKMYGDMDDIHIKDLNKHVNASKLMLHVLGRFPTLEIYIPDVDGALLRGEPKNHDYMSWDTINHGSATSSKTSGGQTLMAQFIVMAMVMRQRADKNSWLFLVSDNPFGKMSAPELVEAVFSLLELLQIQWVVVAPPITNVHITSNFNTIYHMDIDIVEGEKKLTQKIQQNKRKFLEQISILDAKEKDA